jgi:putative transposase
MEPADLGNGANPAAGRRLDISGDGAVVLQRLMRTRTIVAVAPGIRALIRRMSKANPLWGAPRIHGELQKLGVEISQAAVSKYVVRHRRPPSQTWRTFLDNHRGHLVAVDFFVVPTVLFKVLFVFVVLAHERRRVVHINITDALTAQWTAQQLVEAFRWQTAPRYLLRDRDAV